MKTCVRCGLEKVRQNFYARTVAPDGLNAACKDCMKAAEKKSADARRVRLAVDPDLRDAVRRQGREFRRRERDARYGLQPGEHDALVRLQGGVCAACGRTPEEAGMRRRPLHVDHDHATGRVRGLLCHNCNLALGQVADSVDRLMGLVAYLMQHAAIEVGR